MDYSDLKMIQKRKKILRHREQLKGYEGELETFLIEPCLEVCLPIKAVQVEGDFFKEKYPNVHERTKVYEMPDSEADFLFQISKDVYGSEKIEDIADSVKQMIMRLHPAYTFYGSHVEDTKNRKVGWFDFDSFGLDGMIYNFTFTTKAMGRLCMGSFHCERDKAVWWKPVFIKIIHSFREVEVQNES